MENEITRQEREVVYGLQLEVRSLLYHWRLFKQLYSDSDESVTILKNVADEFFGVVEILLWDHVLLVIGKLLDPPKTRGQKNLNFESVIEILSLRKGVDQVIDLKRRFEKIKDDCELIKRIRHKRLAHFDRAYMIERLKPESALPGVNLLQLEKAIFEAKKLMNEIEKMFGEEPFKYDFEDHDIGNDLIWYLKQSGSYAEVRKREKEGKMDEMGFS